MFPSFSGSLYVRKPRKLFELIGKAMRVIKFSLINLAIAAFYWQRSKAREPLPVRKFEDKLLSQDRAWK
jgi:hypothetical protein